MPNVQHIYTQSGPPTNPPAGIGHHLIDTLNQKIYLSKGLSVVADWQLVGSGGLPNGGSTGQALVKLSGADGDADWATVVPTGSANAVPYFNGSGNLADLPGMVVNANGGISFDHTDVVTDNGYQQWNINSLVLDPSQNSPTATRVIRQDQIAFDPNSTGFTIGTGGNSCVIYSMYANHQGTSNIGCVNYIQTSFELGNGTDPINVKGHSLFLGFGTYHTGVTINGAMQGFIFQPSAQSGVTLDASVSYSNIFGDFTNFSNVAVGGWSSFSASPQFLGVQNNYNFTGFNCNPTISQLQGNAGVVGFSLSGTITAVGTNNTVQGVLINPTLTGATNTSFNGVYVGPQGTGTNVYGLNIDMTNITATNKYAATFTGDVQINGNLSFSGGLSIGKLQAFYMQTVVDGGGTPTTVHGLISAQDVPASATIANIDTIGVNTAALITVGANATATSGPIGIGLAALALPCVVQTHTGSNCDVMSAAVYAISLDGGSTGGTIDLVNLCRTTAIPNGITTINNLKAFRFDLPFGGVATNTWGIYLEPDCQNWINGSLKIGTGDTTTNSSVGLEINSTTRALLLSRMTTTQRDALTAVAGMMVFNTTTSKFQGYDGAVWADLN